MDPSPFLYVYVEFLCKLKTCYYFPYVTLARTVSYKLVLFGKHIKYIILMRTIEELVAVNIFEIIKDAFTPFMDGEKKPLHTGEVMNLWFFLAQVQEAVRLEQIAFNTTQDKELKERLEDLINNVHKPIIQDLQEFLRKESVPLPPTSPEKPFKDNQNEYIPEWAKMADMEIANFVVYKIVLGMNTAIRGLTESVRADVGVIFSKILITKLTFFLTYRQLMEQKGWLKIPPYYNG